MLSRDRTIGAFNQQIMHERTIQQEEFDKKVVHVFTQLEDIRLQNENLKKLNDDLKKENEAQTKEKSELEEKICELEQTKLENARQITQLKNQKEDAIQGQESYKSLLQRIQHQQSVAQEFQSPYSFGNRALSQEPERAEALTNEIMITEQHSESLNQEKELETFKDAVVSVNKRVKSITGTGRARKETDYDKLSMSEFLDDKFNVGQEDEGQGIRSTLVRTARVHRASLVKINKDLDAMSEMRLNKVLFKDGEEELLLFDGEPQLGSKKAQKESKLKRLNKENKTLKQQIVKLKDLLATDKNLKQMKSEYNELLTDCKQIVTHLETKVQQSMLTEAVGPESAALMELLERTTTSPGMPKQKSMEIFSTVGLANLDNNTHMDLNRFNYMTMNHFEQNFVQEINERVNQAEVLTVRDLKKIRSMLKFIYRQVMRLTSEKEPTD